MDASKAGTETRTAEADERPVTQEVTAERARARAYLDLWERHVVHVALYGPAPARGRPPT